MAGVEELVGGMGGLGGALEGLGKGGKSPEGQGQKATGTETDGGLSKATEGRVQSQATTCLALLEALLGCSQVDLCR